MIEFGSFQRHNLPFLKSAIQPHLAAPWFAYSVSGMFASLIYVIWLTVSLRFWSGQPHASLIFALGFSLFFWLAGGFALTLLLMIVPWIIAVWAYRKLRWASPLYFSGIGAVIVFTLGCATASIAPKPLFIEDQTFLEGALIAAERQGVCLLFAGVALGTCYWWFGERQLQPRPDKS